MGNTATDISHSNDDRFLKLKNTQSTNSSHCRFIMATEPLASLSLTHVHYIPGDKVSYACAWLALVPQGLCVAYVTLIWSTREIEIISMFVGQMASEAINWVLKRVIQEERPAVMNGKGYGMPSSHAQFVFFFAVSLSLFLLVRHGQDEHEDILSAASPIIVPRLSATKSQPKTIPHSPSRSSPTPYSSLEPVSSHPVPLSIRLLTSLASLFTAFLVAISRIYLNYHTPQQVAVGAVAGIICGLAWFWLTNRLRTSGFLVNWLLETQVARFFRIKDLVVRDDLVEAEWGRWRAIVERERDRKSGKPREKEKEYIQGERRKEGQRFDRAKVDGKKELDLRKEKKI